MDFPFLSLDAAPERTTNVPAPDATAPSNPDAPADGFKKVINQLSNGNADTDVRPDLNLNPDAPLDPNLLAELKIKTDTKLDEKVEIDPSQQVQAPENPDPTQNPNMDLTTIIAQLNLATAMQQNQQVQQPDEQTAPQALAPAIVATNPKILPQTPTQKTTAPAAVKPTTDLNAAKQFNLNMVNNVAQMTNDSTDSDEMDSDPTESQGVAMNLGDLKLMDQKQQVDEKIKLPEAANLPVQNDNDVKPAAQDPNLVNSIAAKTTQHVKLDQAAATDATGATTMAPSIGIDSDQNKYLNMFTQLGNFINSHTHDLKPTSDFSQALNAAQQQSAIASAAQHDEKLQIELIPNTTGLSSGALQHEVYNAKIQIHPRDLGPVTAELTVDKNSAQLNILTHSEHVKGIIEANLPQLKDRLQSSDINLTNVHVQTSTQFTSREQNQQSSADKQPFQQQEGTPNLNNQEGAAAATSGRGARRIDSLVDTYA